MGPLFFIMAGLVLAVVAGAFVIGGGKGDKPKAQVPQRDGSGGYVSVKRKKVYKPQEPWTGEINRMYGTVAQGMSEAQVVAQFKPADVAHLTHSEYDGVRTLEFPDAPDQGGAFGTSAGVKLLVKVDMETGKVVWFQPPIRSNPE